MFRRSFGFAVSIVGLDADNNITNVLYTRSTTTLEEARDDAVSSFRLNNPKSKIIIVNVAALKVKWFW